MKQFLCTAALVFWACLVQPATAQITAQDVWQTLSTQITRSARLSAQLDAHPDGLSVQGLRLSWSRGALSIETTLTDAITLRNQAGGAVLITLPETLRATTRITRTGADPIEVTHSLSQEGLAITARGTPEAIRFNLSAASLSHEAKNSHLEADHALNLQIAQLSGQWQIGHAAPGPRLATGPLSYEITRESNTRTRRITGTSDSAKLTTSDADQGRDHILAVTGSQITAALPGLPVRPLETRMGAAQLQLRSSQGSKDTTLTATLEDVTLSPENWRRLDPRGLLGRDPMGLGLDLDIQRDPATGRLQDIALERFDLRALETRLTGKGQFQIGAEPPTGQRRPSGTLDLSLTGGMTLLNRLSTLNLISREEALGLKLLSGLLAQPGGGPDRLISRITLDETGTINANGRAIP